MASFFGPTGPLAQKLPGYELRPSQLEMAEAVKRALLTRRHALIEAPTGTGKSIAYLLPAILSGRTVVIATANKSLQTQLYQKDIPFLAEVLGKPIDAVLVKGRSNYLCTWKWEQEAQIREQMALYGGPDEQVRSLRAWLKTTESGDVDELPFLLAPDLRPKVVSFTDDCLQRECPHYDDACWINQMRDRAAMAQVIITNHHLLLNALELGVSGERLLPPAPIYVIDEAHGLEQTATSVYETLVTDFAVEQLLLRSTLKEGLEEDELDRLRFQNTLAFQEVAALSRDSAFRIEGDLEEMKKLGHMLEKLGEHLKNTNPFAGPNEGRQETTEEAAARRGYELTLEQVNSTARKLLTMATSRRDADFVRYAVRAFERRHTTLELHAAPINPAELLTGYLFHPENDDGPVERTVICTSATLATNGHFEHFKARCGIQAVGEERVLPPVFDYPKQTLLYQPAISGYDYRSPDRFYAEAAVEIERLLEVSRGRTLCLFTSWSGLQHVHSHLVQRGSIIWPLRAQGIGSRDSLLDWFRETPHSVLLATRSFWEGIDIPGDDLSLVVLDKMPFPTPGDPLHSARMNAIKESGEDDFKSYMQPLMTLSLKQGFGRLVRRSSDRGVVAILDERLTSKSYGRQTRQDLPAARFSRDFRQVHRFYQAALDSPAEFALNVWATAEPDDAVLSGKLRPAQPGVRWRWRLVRLSDGKADGQDGLLAETEGLTAGESLVAGEVQAAVAGLQNLQERIARAQRQTSEYVVELRCSVDAAKSLESAGAETLLLERWTAERARWRGVPVLALAPTESE